MTLDEARAIWQGRVVRYGSYAAATVVDVVLTEDRAGMPSVSFVVERWPFASVWPAGQCEWAEADEKVREAVTQ